MLKAIIALLFVALTCSPAARSLATELPTLQITGTSAAYESPQSGTIRATPGSTLTLTVIAKVPDSSPTGLSLFSARFRVTPTDTRIASEVQYTKPPCWLYSNNDVTIPPEFGGGTSNTLRAMKTTATSSLPPHQQRFDLNNDGLISVEDWTLFIRAYTLLIVIPETSRCDLATYPDATEGGDGFVDDADVVAYYGFLSSKFQQSSWGDVGVHLNTHTITRGGPNGDACDDHVGMSYQRDARSVSLVTYRVTIPRDIANGSRIVVSATPQQAQAVDPRTFPYIPEQYFDDFPYDITSVSLLPGSIVIDVSDEPIKFADTTRRAVDWAVVSIYPVKQDSTSTLPLSPNSIVPALDSQAVAGAACDGVTTINMVWPVPGPGVVDFKLSGESATEVGIGSISSLADATARKELNGIPATKVGDKWYAIAFYTAPTDFWRSDSDTNKTTRSVAVAAKYVSSGVLGESRAAADIQLRRPPVVLIHGLNSDGSIWDESYFLDNRFVVHNEDYSGTSTEHFNVNKYVSMRAATAARYKMRNLGGAGNGFACSKVSIVGHSMGGLLARIHASNVHGTMYTSDNQGQGDIYKLITLYTPHQGSEIACAAMSTRYKFLAAAIGLDVSAGALEDLRPDSEEITQLRATPVPTHAIAGIGGDSLLNIVENPGLVAIPIVGRGLYWLAQAMRSDTADFLGTREHDGVVGLLSAKGGLSGNATSVVPPFYSSEWTYGLHFAAGIDSVRRNFIVSLFDRPVSSSFFSPTLLANQGIPPLPVCMPHAESPLVQATTGGVSVGSTAFTVPAGGSLTIAVGGSGDFSPDKTVLIGDIGQGAVAIGNGSFQVLVPMSAVGSYVVRALSFDRSNRYSISAPITIRVTTQESLVAIRVIGGDVILSGVAQIASLSVIAQYSGVATRDVAREATYVIENPGIVQQVTPGVLQGIRPGSTSVQISFGGRSTTTRVTVLGVACSSDLTGDSLVDDSDFTLFAAAYNRLVCDDPAMPTGCPADFNRDGFVDDLDFQVFVVAYDAVFCP